MGQRVRPDGQIFMQEETGKRFVDPLERGKHCSAYYEKCENRKDNQQPSPVPSLMTHVVLPLKYALERLAFINSAQGVSRWRLFCAGDSISGEFSNPSGVASLRDRNGSKSGNGFAGQDEPCLPAEKL